MKNKYWKKIIIVFGLLVFSVVLWFTIGMFVFMNFTSCEIIEIQKENYLDDIIIHETRDCGATTYGSTVIRINNETIFVVRGVFASKYLEIRVEKNKIVISYTKEVSENIFKKKEKYKDINILYEKI